ncbi:Chitinase [hydrothermal vent metagenome]|uniref:Chitinase n=1 Tax=hydrothermal vent metagenome TaxID=652676 RepID=A0A1W1CIZ9_9ZZZZ
MADKWEYDNGLNKNNPNDALVDNDKDGLSNLDEFLNDGNPKKEDTDDDKMLDAFEYEYDLNLTKDDTLEDKDKDGVSNIEEYADGTNPSDINSFLPPLLAPNISIEKLTNTSIKVKWDEATTDISVLPYCLSSTVPLPEDIHFVNVDCLDNADDAQSGYMDNLEADGGFIINNLLPNKIYNFRMSFVRYRYPYAEDVVATSAEMTIDTKTTNLKVNAGEDAEVVFGTNAHLIARVEGNDDNLDLVYSWKENNRELSSKSFFLKSDWELGTHKITLTVSDGISTVEDEVIITITKEATNTPKFTLKKTGQNVSYATSDDGDYEMGISLNYTKENNNVLDRVTGLKWADNADSNSTQKSWDEAKSYCVALGNAWRLPSREELSSLVHYDNYNPSIDKSFHYTAFKSYWSSSQSLQNTDNAWVVNFAYGTEGTSGKTSLNEVRCVATVDSALANAGEDIIVQEGEDINLSAIYSTLSNLIIDYTWTSGLEGLWLGIEVMIEDYFDGMHIIELTTTDKNNNISTDEVIITIVSDNKEIKKTGQNVSYATSDDGDYEMGISLNYTKENNDVLDRVTGLKWQDESETNSTTYSWEEARDYCNNRGERMPMREELSSLIHYDNYNPAIDRIFDYTANGNYWTYSTSKTSYRNAWIVNFTYGTESTVSKTSQNYVRCVSTSIPATANAGEEQFIQDGDSITLSATNTIHKEYVDSYTWEEDGEVLGTGEVLELDNIRDGEHHITLTIRDLAGNILSIDSITVTIVYNNKVIKQTGQNISYGSFDDGHIEGGVPLNYTSKDNTILDRVTSLLWKDTRESNSSTYTWEEARSYCSGRIGEWRLPMREELSGLIDYGSYNPAIDESFIYIANANYWTLSTSERNSKSAWIINFAYGTESTSTKTTQNYVRCISANSPARANAGEDLFVERGDSFNLIGSYSPHKDLISSYIWSEENIELGYTEILPIHDMFDGEHKILLTIEDDEGNTDRDETLITIVSKQDKLKATGQSETYGNFDDGHYHKGYSLNYSDNGATVSDGVFTITWQDDGDTDNNAQTWKEAKAYCASLSLGGSWRLPTRQELSSLVHYANYNPAIDGSFDSTANASYWTLSTSDKTDKSAWIVNFAYGTESTSSKTSSHYTRCVKTTN